MKYSELMVEWLEDLGYTHCFFVAGGNSMHLLDGVRKRMTCVPVVHEVAAGIAVEYFNEAGGEGRAFALVTAGPGLTNIVTALAGAYLESRECLVLGGQAKRTDLARGDLRQRGIQEVDGRSIAAPVCVTSERIERPIGRARFVDLVRSGTTGRPGPVFLEVCLDAQGAPVDRDELERETPAALTGARDDGLEDPGWAAERIASLMSEAQRPVWLLGGGVTRATAERLRPALRESGVPLMTTWNAMDRLDAREPLHFGRPNTWGQRSANVLLQQADLVVALGTRLGLQQTGFNWQAFGPRAKVVQIDLDEAELAKGHPVLEDAVRTDANALLDELVAREYPPYDDWIGFCGRVRAQLPTVEDVNTTAGGYLDPYRFTRDLAELCRSDDLIVPCSSGGAFTVTMQTFAQREGQTIISDKGLASMGYGLSGSIGAALAHPSRRTVLLEGDGGFAQNLQELATVQVNGLNLKIFVFANEGYASIRMTQRNYFGGQYLGCDVASGLGFPDWAALFAAFGVPVHELDGNFPHDERFQALFDASGPAAFVVPIDPEQTYFPKISSRVAADGSMESNPLHFMSPDLPEDVAAQVLHFLQADVTPGGFA
jgi:acetolactate synthase-1/2/3 large subunit